MLPANFRYWLFDRLSLKTMRFISAVPMRSARGLTKDVYQMIQEDFFRNGSLTSRSRVPELMAAIWTAGREAMLVEDKVDRTLKDAISAVLSETNDCPYCGDMLISLVHAAGDHQSANSIFETGDFSGVDRNMRPALEWVRAASKPGTETLPPPPFTEDQLPEIFGTLMGMSDINRFSHVVMEDSPLNAPMGLDAVKAFVLRLFGAELTATRKIAIKPGRALGLLPAGELPADMEWALPNPRVADALSRWVAAVERETADVVSPEVRQTVEVSLAGWRNEQMPLSRSWVENELGDLEGMDREIARLTIVLAKAPYQVDQKLAEAVMGKEGSEKRFVRILAWASFAGARRFVQTIVERCAIEGTQTVESTQARRTGDSNRKAA